MTSPRLELLVASYRHLPRLVRCSVWLEMVCEGLSRAGGSALELMNVVQCAAKRCFATWECVSTVQRLNSSSG